MRAAIDAALASVAAGGGPFGAVVVKDGTIVGVGSNRVVPDRDPTAHAEVQAIRAAARQLGTHLLAGCEIYTSCAPCPMCLAAIYWARIERIHYAASCADAAHAGFDDGWISEQLAMPSEARHIVSRADGTDEGSAPFRAWREKTDRVRY